MSSMSVEVQDASLDSVLNIAEPNDIRVVKSIPGVQDAAGRIVVVRQYPRGYAYVLPRRKSTGGSVGDRWVYAPDRIGDVHVYGLIDGDDVTKVDVDALPAVGTLVFGSPGLGARWRLGRVVALDRHDPRLPLRVQTLNHDGVQTESCESIWFGRWVPLRGNFTVDEQHQRDVTQEATPEPEQSGEVAALRQQLVNMQEETARVVAALQDQTRSMEVFKERVGEHMMELAREHGWCQVAEDALRELGIPVPSNRHEIVLNVQVKIEADLVSARTEVSDGFVERSIVNLQDEIEGMDLLDDDWTDAAVTDVSVECDSVERV